MSSCFVHACVGARSGAGIAILAVDVLRISACEHKITHRTLHADHRAGRGRHGWWHATRCRLRRALLLLLFALNDDLGVVLDEVCDLGRLAINDCLRQEASTWLVLKTNFVPRVRLSVTIIKFRREGL